MADPAVNPESLPVSRLSKAIDLQKKYDSVSRSRQLLDRQWKINLAFYKGRQYVYFNRRSRRIESLPTEDGEKPKYRIRLTSNQIAPGTQSLISKLLKTKPRMMATPGTSSDKDLQAAQMSERLLEFWWDDFGLDDSLEEGLLWAAVAGQGYWKICWDEHAGRQMSFLLGPDGQPILDDHAKDQFRALLEQHQIPPQEQVVYMGDIKVEVVSPFHLFIDPSAKKFSEAKWAFHESYLDPDTLKAMYKKDLPPDSTPASPEDTLPMGSSDRSNLTVRKVVTGYFLPTASMPKGRIVTWSGEHILDDQPWYYPTNELPFVKFPGVRVPGEVYDTSVVEQAIPIQKELNRTLSQIVEYKNLTIKPQWKAPVGSIMQAPNDEPGAIWEYNPIGAMAPEPIMPTALPAYVFNHLESLKVRLDEIFAKTEITEGSVPPNVEAGTAIDLLQEMATDRLAPQIRLIEMSIARAGRLMLSLAKKYYIEPRMLKIRGSAGSFQVKQFTQSDIDGAVNVVVESGSGLPRTRAGRQARIMEMIDRQLIRPDQAYKYLDMADMTGLAQQFALDEDQARREHEKLNQGQILNQQALQEAQGQVQMAGQMGVNPETGEPFQDENDFEMWAQQAMQSAAVSPGVLDNDAVHLDIHAQVIKGVEFERMPPEVQQAYVMHAMQHQGRLQSQQQAPSEPVRTTLQLKSTVGPTTQAEILSSQGVNVTPEQTSEPPLETWVSDSVDKADVDGSGPGQDGGVNLAKVAQINADAQANALAKAQDSNRSAISAEADLIDRVNQSRREEELHGEKLRGAAAQADAAEKNARVAGQKPPSGRPK